MRDVFITDDDCKVLCVKHLTGQRYVQGLIDGAVFIKHDSRFTNFTPVRPCMKLNDYQRLEGEDIIPISKWEILNPPQDFLI